MCLRPIEISHERKSVPGLYYANNLIGRYDPAKCDTYLVSCGKCPECIRSRQNQLAYKLYQRINRLNTCYHVTLTYRPEALPFSQSLNYIDCQTGEVWRCSDPEIITDLSALTSLRDWYREQTKSSSPVYFYSSPIQVDEFSKLEAVFTPSLNRTDVRNAIKICRILFKRRYGFNIDFTYSFCGEYGPRSARPHYHCVFASKDDITDFVNMLSNYWIQHYGFTVVKKVNRFNDNQTDGYELVAKYISKYMSKGDFECQSVISGYAEKGRVCQSKGLDPRLKEEVFESEIVPYFRAYDLFGSYSPLTLTLDKSGKRLSPSQIDSLCDEIIKRSYVTLGLSKISMPRYLKTAIFYYKNYNGKLRSPVTELSEEEKELRKKCRKEGVPAFGESLIRSPLSYLVSYRLQFLQAQDRAKDLERIKERGSESFLQSLRISMEHRAARIEKAFKKFLSGSFSQQ